MKINKGDAGYINSRKKKVIIKAILQFGIVAALIALGVWQTGDKMNWLTIVAVLGCLPAAKTLVEVITIFPYKSIEETVAKEIAGKTELLTVSYDMVLTTNDHIMPIDSVVISNNTICGYTSSEKVDTVFAAKHMKQMMYANRFTDVSVKVFDNYAQFLSRAEGMNNIAAIDKNDTKKHEAALKNLILNISL